MSSHTGLNQHEVNESRKKYGSNILTPPERTPWWKLWLEKFEDPIIRILLIAAGVSFVIGWFEGSMIESIGIVIAILLATTVGFINEYKAENEFSLLSLSNDDEPVRVFRAGSVTTIPKKLLVVGDVLVLETGAEVPADAKLIEVINLCVNEASLTGESEPVTKELISSDETNSFLTNIVYRGTFVVDGYGVAIVSRVGDHTEIGKTAKAASEEIKMETPLNKQLDRLSKLIGACAFGLAGTLFFTLLGVNYGTFDLTHSQTLYLGICLFSGLIVTAKLWVPAIYDVLELSGYDITPPILFENQSVRAWSAFVLVGVGFVCISTGVYFISGADLLPLVMVKEMLQFFMIAVTLIVVAVPEGLPMSVTLSLAYNMRRMIAAKNLVRRMHACETIGSATVICSDKTGTLTTSQMSVFETGFAAHGDFNEKGSSYNTWVSKSMAVNSTAEIDEMRGTPIGNPTEGALLLWLKGHEIDYKNVRDENPIISRLYFTTERKYMATVVKYEYANWVLVKGAPEVLLDHSIVSTPKLKLLEEIETYQKRGMRVISFALKNIGEKEDITDEDIRELLYLGHAVIVDPIRDDVPDAISSCIAAGVNVKVVTGDNVLTATEISRQIGLIDDKTPDQFCSGEQLNAYTDSQLTTLVQDLKVIYRARPTDKMRLVKALQDRGEVVAVTGDGVNDAPALNYADVGLSMGITGTAVAKAASDIVILDDSFSSIKNAILWGRSLYKNIQKFICFQLTINVVACGIAVLGPFFNIKFPLTIIQMLWVNLIMDTFAALALATEPPDVTVMKEKPRSSKDFIISKIMRNNILGFGIAFLLVMLGFIWHINMDEIVTRHELTLFFTTFVMMQFWNMFNVKSLGGSVSVLKTMFNNTSFLAVAGIILIGQIAIVQFGGEMFRTEPLSVMDWAVVSGLTSLVFVFGEVMRFFKRVVKS